MQQIRAFSYVEWRQETIIRNRKAVNIMVGRTRKIGKRHPGGQLVREKQLTRLEIAQRMPHRRGLPDDLIEHERAETQFGRLSMKKLPKSPNSQKADEYVISPDQYQAGVRWRKTVMDYRAVLHSPSEFPRSIAGAILGGGGGDRHMTDEEAIRRKSAYNESHDAIMLEVGINCLKALNDATVHERFVEPSRIDRLRAALDVLVSLAYRGRRRTVA